ncbi:MAG: hypothetical protein ACQEU4_23455 [Bacillota bacterium]
MLITILFSFIIGLINIGTVTLFIFVQFLLSNILIGILAPIKNSSTPFTATFLGSVTLTVLNYIVAYYVFNIYVLADPVQINNNLLLSTSISLAVALVYIKFFMRKSGKKYD